MKLQTKIFRPAGIVGLLLGCASLLPAGAAATNKTMVVRARTADAAVSAPAAESAVPRAVFVIPRKATEGKDPFFPNATRVYGSDNAARSNPVISILADLTLKGISGTAEQPLAIVNTTTLTTGEIGEVLLKGGRLKVQCLEINMTAGKVLLQVGGERRELQLQPMK